MANIKLTASIIKKDKGCYVARCDELFIITEPASTQRGAIRKLKDTAQQFFRQAAEHGKLDELLNDAGYTGYLSWASDVTLERHTWDSDDIFLPLPRRERPLTGDKEK